MKMATIRWHASHLAEGLRKTSSLRRLALFKEFSDAEFRCIAEAAYQSESLEQLHLFHIYGEDVGPIFAIKKRWLRSGRSRLDGFFVKNTDWALLTNWLTDNRRVHSFEVPPPAIGHEALVNPLVECLQDNYCIITVKIDDVFLGQTLWTKVKQMAQRNYGLLQCAAAFALGSSHKRAAVAYERVSWHPQLCKTIKSMGNLSTGEAMERIQQSNRRLRDQAHFWQLCGIVPGRIVCHEAPAAADGASVRQLDNVGEDVLQLIRSYLKVGDILDDEDELPEIVNSLSSNERYCKRKRSDSPQE
ncbi:hypothetical protein HPB51_012119 [Rhipicephalus microplus]|uniref:Uncharacterized protein n=1 Tax=Rhipicephalus microplus TaxID=6941 RepID=A0A9J6DUA2_RHIMP|nr:hypothetical protein HPB51_012119 [Rhipicephalus microplus]